MKEMITQYRGWEIFFHVRGWRFYIRKPTTEKERREVINTSALPDLERVVAEYHTPQECKDYIDKLVAAEHGLV